MNKQEELAWIHSIRSSHPGRLPEGAIEQPDPPAADVLIKSSDGSVAIELTQLVPDNSLPIWSAQRDALKDAQLRFEHATRQRLFVNVSFADGRLPSRRVLARELCEFVMARVPLTAGAFQVLPGSREARDLPAWMNGISIFEPHRGGADWVGGSVWSVGAVARADVEHAIRKKASRLDDYRRHMPEGEVWLVIVVDQLRLAADWSIPSEAEAWRFGHDFDRVVLASAFDFLEF